MKFFRRFFNITTLSAAALGYLGTPRLFAATAFQNKERKETKYEAQFRRFASREYSGVLYMTPDDFLYSLFRETSPVKHFHSLTQDDVKKFFKAAQLQKTPNLFRSLGNQGLISYTDYLFLLGLLNKPTSGFGVAFKMLDVDYSGKIDVDEFCVLYNVSAGVPDKAEEKEGQLALYSKGNLSEQSTLMQLFFGKDGKSMLDAEEFYKFIANLQDEILEVEFSLNSTNGKTLSPLKFSEVILEHTKLHKVQYNEFLTRLNRLPADIEITLEDFKNFFRFLNHLEDFQLAMKMYMLVNRPISLVELKRAIKACTNINISEYVLQTLVCLFDEDGDERMSPKEFMVLFRNRRHRGIHKNIDTTNGSWQSYKKCVNRAVSDN